MKRKLLASSILAASLFGGHAFAADDTIKVGDEMVTSARHRNVP